MSHPKRGAGPLLIFNLAGLNLSVQRLNGRLAVPGAPACVFPDRGITPSRQRQKPPASSEPAGVIEIEFADGSRMRTCWRLSVFCSRAKDIRIKIGLMDRQIYLIVFLAVTASSPTISAQPDASRPSLVIMPSSGIQASGPQGGPFSPAVVQYLVRATSGTIRFAIAPPFWLTADPRLGTTGAEGVMITLTINQRALRLPPGTYGPRTTFTNLTSGQGSTTRSASLIVHDPPPSGYLLDERGGYLSDDRKERLRAR